MPCCGMRRSTGAHATGPAATARWALALSRVRAALDRAGRYQEWIDAEEGRTAAGLARAEGLSRARVSQVLRLQNLVPEVVKDIRKSGRRGGVPGEADLRRVAGLPTRLQQATYAEMVRERKAAGRRKSVPRADFRFAFERARRWRDMLEVDERLTLADIGRREGYTSTRVSQLLNLLDLAPEIIEVLDVHQAKLPKGVTVKAVRPIGWIRDHGEQLEAFRQVCPRHWALDAIRSPSYGH